MVKTILRTVRIFTTSKLSTFSVHFVPHFSISARASTGGATADGCMGIKDSSASCSVTTERPARSVAGRTCTAAARSRSGTITAILTRPCRSRSGFPSPAFPFRLHSFHFRFFCLPVFFVQDFAVAGKPLSGKVYQVPRVTIRALGNQHFSGLERFLILSYNLIPDVSGIGSLGDKHFSESNIAFLNTHAQRCFPLFVFTVDVNPALKQQKNHL